MTTSVSSNAAAPHSLNLDPVIPVMGRILSGVDLNQSLKAVVNCLDSNPLLNVSLVSLKSVPHVRYGDNRAVQEFENAVSSRVRYFEAAFMSLAALVYNAAFSLVFTAVSLVTLFQVQTVVDQMRKHWIHTGLAVAALGIGITGTVSPEFGINANLAGVLAIAGGLVLWAKGDLTTKLAASYHQHSAALKAAVQQGLNGDRRFFSREFTPFFNYLDTHLQGDQLQTTAGLRDFADGLSQRFPNVSPEPTTGTPGLIVSELQRVFLGQITPTSAT